MRREGAVPAGAPYATVVARAEGETRRPWSRPAIEPLPPLSALTMESIPGSGIIGDGGASTVF